jgi:6-phosphogluconolactonase
MATGKNRASPPRATFTRTRSALVVCTAFLLADCGGGDTPQPQYNVGGTVSGLTGSGLVLQNNGGDDLSVSASGPFVFSTPLPADTAYSVTVSAQPTDPTSNCIVMKAGRSGVVQIADIRTVSVVCAAVAKTAYVGYIDSASSLSATATLGIDPRSGALTRSQTQVGQTAPYVIAAGGQYAYSLADGGIDGYAIDPVSGSLQMLAGNPFGVDAVPPDQACTFPGSGCGVFGIDILAADPRGPYLYAYYLQWGPCCPQIPVVSSIVPFSIDPTTGALTALSPGGGGAPTDGIRIDAGGRYLYSADEPNIHLQDAGGLRYYLIDKTSGALTYSGVDSAAPWPISFEPEGSFAYALNTTTGSVQALTIDPASGALTNVGSSVTEPGLNTLIVDPAGAFAYGGCTGGICGFSLDPASGQLTALPGSPFATPASFSSIVFDPSGKFVFGICGTAICGYALDPVTGVPKLAPAGPFTLTGVVPGSIVLSN